MFLKTCNQSHSYKEYLKHIAGASKYLSLFELLVDADCSVVIFFQAIVGVLPCFTVNNIGGPFPFNVMPGKQISCINDDDLLCPFVRDLF